MDDDEDPEIPKRKSEETINVIRKCVELAKPDLVVFGGDNISDFTENVEGIDLVQTIGAGYHTYGGERGRLIILDENVPYKYETEIYRIDKISNGKV